MAKYDDHGFIAGYTPKDIVPKFKNSPKNVILPDSFLVI